MFLVGLILGINRHRIGIRILRRIRARRHLRVPILQRRPHLHIDIVLRRLDLNPDRSPLIQIDNLRLVALILDLFIRFPLFDFANLALGLLLHDQKTFFVQTNIFIVYFISTDALIRRFIIDIDRLTFLVHFNHFSHRFFICFVVTATRLISLFRISFDLGKSTRSR
uniref:Uncharacterized protein n=1 Tax=Strigamia maritima TaxID=126957 RepID=T1IHG5_STRMM